MNRMMRVVYCASGRARRGIHRIRRVGEDDATLRFTFSSLAMCSCESPEHLRRRCFWGQVICLWHRRCCFWSRDRCIRRRHGRLCSYLLEKITELTGGGTLWESGATLA